MDTLLDIDQEVSRDRSARHVRALTPLIERHARERQAHIDRCRREDPSDWWRYPSSPEWRNLIAAQKEAVRRLGEEQRLEWIEHPAPDTVALREMERFTFALPASESDEDKVTRKPRPRLPKAPRGNEAANLGIAPPSNDRRGGKARRGR